MFKFLGKLKDRLSKTRDQVFGKISRLLKAKSKIDEELLEEIEEILITGDIGVDTTFTIMENIRKRVKKERYENPEELNFLLRDEIDKFIISEESNDFEIRSNAPLHVIFVVGVNGSGKTTSIGKLAAIYKSKGKKVMLAACDTFRAAACEQLEVWAERAGVSITRLADQTDPSAVIFEAVQRAQNGNYDILLIDTAGRLHTKVNLMQELGKMERVIKRFIPDAPHETLLVIDATTGQNGLSQARHFTDTTKLTGLVLTKLDGTAKGGIVIGITQELKIPVKYIGVGEQIGDLRPFSSKEFVEALFD